MTTHRQNSFIAQVGSASNPVNALDALLGAPAVYTHRLSGGGIALSTKKINDSHMLGNQPITASPAPAPLMLYFRMTNNGYVLYVRTPGAHFGKGISLDSGGAIGAFPPDQRSPTAFDLLNSNGERVTLENLKSDKLGIQLRNRSTGIKMHRYRRNHSPYTYLATLASNTAPFTLPLKITERNAPYLSNPDEV